MCDLTSEQYITKELTLMKGGVRLDIITIHHRRIDIDKGWCEKGGGGGAAAA